MPSSPIDDTMDLRRRVKALEERGINMETTQLGGGGGPPSNALEARIAKVESSVEHIEKDIAEVHNDLRSLLEQGFKYFLITWGGLIAATLGLAWLMAHGFGWLK